MLRVRPIHFTSRFEDFSVLFTALGLALAEDAPGWRIFESPSGRVGLHAVPVGASHDGSTALGFEIRNRDEFARRTAEAGTPVELIEADHGPSARIVGADGFSFLADPVGDRPSSADAAGRAGLAVRQEWHTPDAEAAVRVLADIGGRRPKEARNGSPADFAAKNGGITGVVPAPAASAVFGFEYDGDLPALLHDLTAAGVAARWAEDALPGTLQISTPGNGPGNSGGSRGPALRISGCTRG